MFAFTSSSSSPSAALVPFLGSGSEGATTWLRLSRAERRRLAMAAARAKDAATLWSLTEAWVRTFSRAGAGVSPKTVQNYKAGVQRLLAAWKEEDLLRPDPDAAIGYVRRLQHDGFKPGTIGNHLGAARAFYAALRWEKRLPYEDDEVAALVHHAATPDDRVLVLLGAHAGLRAGECVALRWGDISVTRREVRVQRGKGGRPRTVVMSATLPQALLACPREQSGYVLSYRTTKSAWLRMVRLWVRAGVVSKGLHALRHSAGTRLYAETGDLEATARHLGHQRLETTRVYAKWSDRKLRETIGRW